MPAREGKKRSRNSKQLSYAAGQKTTGKASSHHADARTAAVTISKIGSSKGGKARAGTLTAEQRIYIATNAAKLRWRMREK